MRARLFAQEGPWLFSRGLDLALFGGSALVSWALVALGAQLGLLEAELPEWGFLLCIVAIDVAHVWSTGFRVYFNGSELRRRPLLYLGLPALAYLLGVLLHALGSTVFWRALAYLALYHFIRQQIGFMALYGRRSQSSRAERLLDRSAIAMTMLYPVVHWHAHLPRRFAWFLQGDFVTAPFLADVAEPLSHAAASLCVALCALFLARQLYLAQRGRLVPGKTILLLGTASCWVGGIVLFDSDYVFTVTNVLIHGLPYFALTHRYAHSAADGSLAHRVCARGVVPFLLACVALAWSEETLWDRLVWHERSYLFGSGAQVSSMTLVFVVPLLALPQLTHYLLDGFVWRVRRENPVLRREVESA